MNSLKESLFAYRDAFLQLPLATRAIALGLVVVIGIGMWGIASGVGQNEAMERLFPGINLTDDELTKLQTAFSNARLNDWKVERNSIYVPSRYRDEYVRAADEGNAVPLSTLSFQAEARNSSSPFDAEATKRAREEHAKEMDLGRRIAALPQVRSATVEHDEVTRGPFSQRRQSASVVVTPMGSSPLPGPIIHAIKEMVRGSYAGLAADDVVVTDVNAGGIDPGDTENPLFRARVQWEELYRNKARKLLEGFLPLSIDATVTLDPTMDGEKALLKYGQEPTTLQENSSQVVSESSRPVGGGVPGVASNAYGNKPAAVDSNQVQSTKSTQRNDSVVKVTGEEFEANRTASLRPINLAFSIGVPESYYEKAWKYDYLTKNPTTDPAAVPQMTLEERTKLITDVEEKIREAIRPMLLPRPAGEDQYPSIEVWTHRDIPPLPLEDPSSTALAISWLASSWQTVALIALGLVALLVVRGLGKTTPAPRRDFEEGFGLEIPGLPESTGAAEDEATGPSLQITGKELRDQLSSLVGTNPEAAANVLRGWLDSAAA